MLYYRTDLLRKYGFSHPPRTWDELEMQASRIQRGERAAGRHDFWGYVWQGADYEGLTCNSLEWQSSQGGGNMLEQDNTVDVDNPAAIRAFARAARWVGTISPPGVIAYLEEDSRNVWQSGRAAFLRNWSYVYSLAMRSPEVGKRFAVAPMPAGVDPHSSALGGEYLGISKYTRHRAEAVAFVKYLTGREVEREAATDGGFLPTFPALYRDPAVIRANRFFVSIADVPNRVVRRPAALVGPKYDRVSQTYAHGIHMILTGKLSASEGAAQIQAELAHITGFPNSAPVLSTTGMRPRSSASRRSDSMRPRSSASGRSQHVRERQ
jgi:trehalose/maltose transport system substrate-binding protein